MRLRGNCKQSFAILLLPKGCQSDSRHCQRLTNTLATRRWHAAFSRQSRAVPTLRLLGCRCDSFNVNLYRSWMTNGFWNEAVLLPLYQFSCPCRKQRPPCPLQGGSPQKLCEAASGGYVLLNPCLPSRSPRFMAEQRGFPLTEVLCRVRRAQSVVLLRFHAAPSSAFFLKWATYLLGWTGMSPFFPWHQSLPMNTGLNSDKTVKKSVILLM